MPEFAYSMVMSVGKTVFVSLCIMHTASHEWAGMTVYNIIMTMQSFGSS